MDTGYRLAGNRFHHASCGWCRKMTYVRPESVAAEKRMMSRLDRRVFKKADIREQLEYLDDLWEAEGFRVS